MGKDIEISRPGEKSFKGYLAKPSSGTDNGKGIVVLQEWWGLVPHIKSVADRFAEKGFTALAPDLFEGLETKDPDKGGRLLMALNIEKTEKNLRHAMTRLQSELPKPTKVGVVGFCMGGQLALLAATTSPDLVGAVIDFYGIHPKVNPDFSQLDCPALGFFAGKDTFVTPDKVDALENAVKKVGKTMEFNRFAEAGHAFFNDSREDAYNPELAKLAFEKSLSFFSDSLA